MVSVVHMTERDFEQLYYEKSVANKSGADLVFENIRNEKWFQPLDGGGKLDWPVGVEVDVYWFRDYPSLLLAREYLSSRARMARGRVVRTLGKGYSDFDGAMTQVWMLVVFESKP